jgi:hypothetical protein
MQNRASSRAQAALGLQLAAKWSSQADPSVADTDRWVTP